MLNVQHYDNHYLKTNYEKLRLSSWSYLDSKINALGG